jgi:hypothetical protein
MTKREAFKEAFGSLFIQSDLINTDTRGSLVVLDLLSTQSNMELFYSYNIIDSTTNEVDSIHTSYVFPINIECMRINRLEHDQKEEISFNDTGASHLVAQGLAGSMIEINFNEVDIINEEGKTENLFHYWDRKSNTEENNEYYGISSVNISFEADTVAQYADESFFSPVPEALRMYKKKAEGQYEQPEYYYNPTDDSDWSPEFSGGGYDKETNSYNFKMAGESFKMMTEKPELRGPYYLSTQSPVAYPWKVILKNSSTQDALSPKIQLKYVKIKTP